VPVALSSAHVTHLHAALGALLTAPAVAAAPRWACGVAETLGVLLGAECAVVAVAAGGLDPVWCGDGSEIPALRALADPTRLPENAAVRQPSHDVATWALEDLALTTPSVGDGVAAPLPRAAGLLYETIGFRLHFACLLPGAAGTPRVRQVTALRTRALLDLVAPAFAAGARLRAHPGVNGTHAPDAAADPRRPASPVDDRAADALALALADDYALTARETQAARYLIQGCTNAVLARALGISGNTARHHTERVIAKLGVRSRAEVAWLAVGRLAKPAVAKPGVGKPAPGR
jgi:DNA-binding CsgD family transcriptional regulator